MVPKFGEAPPSPLPSTTSELSEGSSSSAYNAPTVLDSPTSPTSTSSTQLNKSIDDTDSEVGHIIIHENPASPNDDTSGDSSHMSECGDADDDDDDADNYVCVVNVDEYGLLYKKKKK